MANKFEELLAGRAIEELTPDEVQEIIEKMSASDIEKFERQLTTRKPQKRATLKQKGVEDLINAAILKGLRK
jgi:Mg/Co/Ni transporter MgtE